MMACATVSRHPCGARAVLPSDVSIPWIERDATACGPHFLVSWCRMLGFEGCDSISDSWAGRPFRTCARPFAAEVLGRPVQTFLPGNDGGRDAAFMGTWRGAADRPDTKSTIQCKFSIKADARLALANLRLELAKVAELAVQGLAHDYIIMTNAGVTGKAEAAICRAFQEAGAEVCRVFHGDWILRQVQERPRLRMMGASRLRPARPCRAHHRPRIRPGLRDPRQHGARSRVLRSDRFAPGGRDSPP